MIDDRNKIAGYGLESYSHYYGERPWQSDRSSRLNIRNWKEAIYYGVVFLVGAVAAPYLFS